MGGGGCGGGEGGERGVTPDRDRTDETGDCHAPPCVLRARLAGGALDVGSPLIGPRSCPVP